MLNAMRVPTKCHGKAWHPEMVKRILRESWWYWQLTASENSFGAMGLQTTANLRSLWRVIFWADNWQLF
jgi:hypothetical protein